MIRRFSRRHGYAKPDAEITVRHDAPEELRSVIVEIAYESGLTPTPLREIACRVLRVSPNPQNWSEFPNVDGEIRERLRDCEWYQVYDVIEEIFSKLSSGGLVAPRTRGSLEAAEEFSAEVNRYFRGQGIGWQLVDGQIEFRGSESFEDTTHGAREAVADAGMPTAASELHEAILDLSRRPTPDVTGSIQHSIAALECVVRELTGESGRTLGDLMQRHPGLLPKPLDQAVEKVWGYASQSGRHLNEGKVPPMDEAELVVGLSGAVCRYLAKKSAS